MSNFFYYLALTLFIVVAIFMMLLILIQKGRGGGLASAFGGTGGHSPFGTKTGDVLTWATSIVFGIFILLAVILNVIVPKMQSANASQPLVQPVGTDAPVPTEQPMNLPTIPMPASTQPVQAPAAGMALPMPSSAPAPQ